MKRFIELTHVINGRQLKYAFAVDLIQAFHESGDRCVILTRSGEHYNVTDSYDEIRRKILKAEEV